MRKAGRVLGIGLFVALSLLGIMNGVRELGRVDTLLQNSVEVADLVHGSLGLIAAVGMWRRRPWAFGFTIGWGLATVYAATIASFAFSDPTFAHPGTVTGTVAAGASTSIVSALVAWAVRVSTRTRSASPSTTA